MHVHRFYAAPELITGDSISLPDEESHHLARVLRLRPGDEASVFDGEGNEYRCEVTDAGKHSATLRIIEKLEDAVESSLDLTLAQAIGKGDKFDLVVQKATELGVERIVPLITDHTDVKIPQAQSERRVERWCRISLEALKQCGRRRLVQIESPASLDRVLVSAKVPDKDIASTCIEDAGNLSKGGSVKQSAGSVTSSLLIGLVPNGEMTLREVATQYDREFQHSVILLIGPEGGWSDRESDLMQKAACKLAHLGPRVLRTETAGIVAVAIAQFLFGDL